MFVVANGMSRKCANCTIMRIITIDQSVICLTSEYVVVILTIELVELTLYVVKVTT